MNIESPISQQSTGMGILHRGKIVLILYFSFCYMSIKIQPQLESLFYFFATTCSIRRTAQDVG
jgi:hypothetical protein